MKFKASLMLGGAALAAIAIPANAQFNTTLIDTPADFGTIDNTTEAQQILGAPPAGSTTTTAVTDVINFPAVAPAELGFTGDNFVTRSVGNVNIMGGTSLDGVILTVNSDDGFALLLNGAEVARQESPRGPADTSTAPLTLNDGDTLQLDFFELGGGEVVSFFRTDSGLRELVGSDASGIDIVPIPEPAALGLLGIAGLGLLARRRRA